MEIQEIQSLLYSYGDWKAAGNKPRPYLINIEKDNQEFVYFGGTHSRDPHNQQFSILESVWKEFLEKKHSNPVVLIEGGTRNYYPTKEEAIMKDSESGYTTHLATQAGVETVCPEPDREDERDKLLADFSKEEIQYYYFARIIPAWHQVKKDLKINLSSFFENHSQDLQSGRNGDWTDFDWSLAGMKAIHKQLFNAEFDENDIDFIKKIINPTTEFSIINKVARASSAYRDSYIVSRIVEYWNQGRSIFAVFGMAHVVIQEPALRKLLK